MISVEHDTLKSDIYYFVKKATTTNEWIKPHTDILFKKELEKNK